MLRHVLYYSLLAQLLLNSAVSAAESTAHEAPGIWDGDIFTSLFSIALFLVLLAVLGKWAWGPILDGLQKREEFIRQSLADAEKAREDAQKAQSDCEARLQEAESAASDIIARSWVEARELADKLKKETMAESRAMINQTQAEIAVARERALEEIHSTAVEMAAEMAGKIINRSINSADHQELIQNSLDQLNQDT